MELKNKVVVITGSSQGLGKALAIALVKQKAKVIINAKGKAELKKTAEQIKTDYFAGDVTKQQDILNLANFALKKHGQIDIWINNAGIWTPHCSIEELDHKKIHDMMEVNLFGTIYGSQVALAIMKQQGQGIITNIISTSSLSGRALSAGYSASKWAARGFTESLKLATKNSGITVIAIHPDGFKSKIFGGHPPKEYENFMEPDFVAKKIVDNLKKDKPKTEIIISE